MENRNRYALVERQDCVLIVIDVQEKLMPVIDDKDRVMANTARLVQFCRICGIPVVFTEQQKLGPTLSEVKQHVDDFRAIEKVHFNCFYNSEFTDAIDETGRNTLVIAGVESHICVAQTAIAALPDRQVHVVSDAVSSRVPDNKVVALQRMRDAGAVITSTEMFIYEMLVKAGTDEFKSILPLVK